MADIKLQFPFSGDLRPGYINLDGKHSGIDIMGNNLSPILAIDDGKVVFCNNSDSGTNYLFIEHSHVKLSCVDGNSHGPLISGYAHNRFNVVDVGDYVKKGEIIAFSGGEVGKPGAGSTHGPHCHFTLGLKGYNNKENGIERIDELDGKKGSNLHITPYGGLKTSEIILYALNAKGYKYFDSLEKHVKDNIVFTPYTQSNIINVDKFFRKMNLTAPETLIEGSKEDVIIKGKKIDNMTESKKDYDNNKYILKRSEEKDDLYNLVSGYLWLLKLDKQGGYCAWYADDISLKGFKEFKMPGGMTWEKYKSEFGMYEINNGSGSKYLVRFYEISVESYGSTTPPFGKLKISFSKNPIGSIERNLSKKILIINKNGNSYIAIEREAFDIPPLDFSLNALASESKKEVSSIASKDDIIYLENEKKKNINTVLSINDKYICLSTLVKYYGGIVTTSGLQSEDGLVIEVPKFSSSTLKPSLLPYKIIFSDKTLFKDVFTKYSSPENDKNFKDHIFTREMINNLSNNDIGISTAKIYMSSGEKDFYEISLKKIIEEFIVKVGPEEKYGIFDRILISAYKALPNVMFPQYDTRVNQLAVVDYESMPWCGFSIPLIEIINSQTILGLKAFYKDYNKYIYLGPLEVAKSLMLSNKINLKHLQWFFDKIFPTIRVINGNVVHTKPWFEGLLSVAESFQKQKYFPLIFLMSEGYTFDWEGNTQYLLKNYTGTISNTGTNNTNNTVDNMNHYDEKTNYNREIDTYASFFKSSDVKKQMHKLNPFIKPKSQKTMSSTPSFSSSSANNFDLFSQDFKFDAPQAHKRQSQPTGGSASSGSSGGGSKGQAKVTGLDNIGKEKDSNKPDFGKMIQDFFKAQAGGEIAGAASGGESGGGSSGGSVSSSSENSSDNTKSVKEKGKQDFKNILQNTPFFNKNANSKQNDDKKQKTPNFANFIKSAPSQPTKSKNKEKSSNLPSFIGPPKLNFAQPQMPSAPSAGGAGGRVSDFGSSAPKPPTSQANKPASPKLKQKPQMPPMPSLQPPMPPKSQKPVANTASPASSASSSPASSAPEDKGQKKGEDKRLAQALNGINAEKAKTQFAPKIVDLSNNYAKNKSVSDKGEDFIGPRMPGTRAMESALPQPMTVPDFERGAMTGKPSRRSEKMAPKIINRTIKEPDVKLTIRKPPKVDDAIEFARKLGNEQFIESMRMQ